VEAAREAGLLTAAKHFPGHGRTRDDSHDTLPVVRAARQALEAVDLPPFRAAIEAGADAVMTAHVAVPALDDRERPATASRPILNDLLRGEMGFEGLVVTDSLLMEGARAEGRSPGEQAAALLEAGVDVLLDPEDPEAVVDGLVETVQSGALDEARLDEACGRVWALKERVHDRWGMTAFAPGRAEEGSVGGEAHRRAARTLARDGITILDATPDAWPMRPHEQGGELLVVASTPQGHTLEAFEGALEERYAHVRFLRLGGDADEEAVAEARRAASEARRVVVACVVEPAAWQTFALPEAHRSLVRTLAGPHTALLAMGSPHVLDDLPASGARVCTYSSVPASQAAVAAALAGETRSP
jgi:beta-glucosidase-like glycosyl hydrolase